MKKLTFFIFIFSFLSVSGHESDMLGMLNAYEIKSTDYIVNIQPFSQKYTFKMQTEIPDKQYPVTYLAEYDPSKSPEWNITSWNGKTPGKSQKDVLKHRLEKLAETPVMVDENTLIALQENEYLIVTFKLDASTVPSDYMDLKDCDGKSIINTSTGRLEKTVWENYKPTTN
jgi:hypothetical protein